MNQFVSSCRGGYTPSRFSTELATRVLENSLASLAISVPYLLFFVGLRALA